ncbi:efflux RND transporter periplasmic adaptor subunit [Bythopirellula goksoeyrii]|uniref:HlyD family secretion protein n=1 Tax=Bythopirellula goksoeyrii TaxID=1400387 RepID=A0A5B9Q9Z5_9BACT|nr:efflux RND transporter periplasmic adaptor subunit [Bythopirellula goksoeyrii]QEG35874.1 HlyD family secretion protein [Bythopirellula goksoeyrii]
MSKPTTQYQKRYKLFVLGAVVIGVTIAATFTRGQWWPLVQRLVSESAKPAAIAAEEAAHEDEHDHNHAGHNEAASIELSEKGLKNIGYEPFAVKPTQYDKKLSLPAIVVERPGRSQAHVTAPLTGVITEIHSVDGEAIEPSQPLFEMRLTHEELVAAQRDYLRTSENLAIVNREITRLKSLDAGVIAGRRVLEQEYEKQKLEASLRAEAQAMLLHGLSEEQVKDIRNSGQLLQMITIRAPAHTHNGDGCAEDHPYQIQRLGVAQGEQVDAGRELAVLADHCELHIEALAFEDDATQIRRAAEQGRHVTANLLVNDSPGAEISDLEVLYVADQIDPDTRAFKVYLRLKNRIALDKSTSAGKRFVEWFYKPGQRMQLKVPVETWKDQLVLPTTAVVDEGAEAYVYRQNGDHFDQVSVQVLYRDQDSVVVANDGALFQGDVIAGNGAYQMHLALKNKAGGGIDPHAGHNH